MKPITYLTINGSTQNCQIFCLSSQQYEVWTEQCKLPQGWDRRNLSSSGKTWWSCFKTIPSRGFRYWGGDQLNSIARQRSWKPIVNRDGCLYKPHTENSTGRIWWSLLSVHHADFKRVPMWCPNARSRFARSFQFSCLDTSCKLQTVSCPLPVGGYTLHLEITTVETAFFEIWPFCHEVI